jgi:hypothetical protein
MKHTRKIAIAVLAGLVAAGSLCAQEGMRNWRRSPPPLPPAETITVSGPLQLVNGRIAVEQDGKTYYADYLGRLTGFIEGLREGAQVTLTGNAEPHASGPEFYRLHITTMTFNGKVYDNLDKGRPLVSITERPAPPRWKTRYHRSYP